MLKELTGVHQTAFLLAVATVSSNILGLIRDRLLAARFGAGSELDVYYAAFRIPDLLYACSLFFIASTAIIPLFLEKLHNTNRAEARNFINGLGTLFLFCIGCAILILFFLMPYLMPYIAPGFNASELEQSVHLSRIMLLSPLFLGFSNLAASILQTLRRFLVYAASFLLYNVGIIAGIVFLVPQFGLAGLAAGVVAGALLYMTAELFALWRLGYMIQFGALKGIAIKEVLRWSFPRTLGLAVSQITFTAITAFASARGTGSIAVFNFSYNLQAIPLAVIGLSYSVAAFPTMAELAVKSRHSLFFDHLVGALRHILFWTIPLSVLFIVLRAQIVRVVLGAGAFGWAETRLVAASLALFSIGIAAQSLNALFVRAFYALGNSRTPLFMTVFSAILTVVLAFVFTHALEQSSYFAYMFSRLLRVEDISRIAVLGLPLAFSAGSLMNAVGLGLFLGQLDGKHKSLRLCSSLLDMAAGSMFAGVVAYAALGIVAPLVDLDRFWGICTQGLIAGIFGIVSYALFLRARGNRELAEVSSVLHKKFWRRAVVANEQESISS